HPESQAQVRAGFTNAQGYFQYTFHNVKPNATYVFKVQGLIPHTFGSDQTTAWAETTVHTKALVKKFRVTALTNETTKPITFQWKFSNGTFVSATLHPGQ